MNLFTTNILFIPFHRVVILTDQILNTLFTWHTRGMGTSTKLITSQKAFRIFVNRVNWPNKLIDVYRRVSNE